MAGFGNGVFFENNFTDEGERLQIFFKQLHFFTVTRYRSVDPLVGEVDLAADLFLKAEVQQNGLKLFRVIDAGVSVECYNYAVLAVQERWFLCLKQKSSTE